MRGIAAGIKDLEADSTGDPRKRDANTVTVRCPGALVQDRQFGTAAYEHAIDVATAPSGEVVAIGVTDGDLDATSAGGTDAFLRTSGP